MTAAYPQGIITWEGVQSFVSGQFSFTHGVGPSIATIKIAPQNPFAIARIGTMSISYGGQVINFFECLCDYIQVNTDDSGMVTWTLYIQDRRWKWKEFGGISGNYNVRKNDADGQSEIDPDTARNPQELATLCFLEMGETDFDVSALPTNDFPEIDWDYELPAKALLDVTERYGCRVSLDLNGAARIFPAGQGQGLPIDQYISGSNESNPPDMPSKFVLAAAHTLVQYDLTLFAVGLDIDNEWKPLDALSYKPTTPGGWNDADIPWFNCIADKTAQELAKKTVYKAYMVEIPVNLPGLDPDDAANDEVLTLDRILPLKNTQIARSSGDGLTPAGPLAAWVYGVWWDQKEVGENVTDMVDPTVVAEDKSKGYFGGQFTVDTERGIVMFNEPMYQVQQVEGMAVGSFNGEPAPADIRLRTSFNVRDVTTNAFLRRQFSLSNPEAEAETPSLFKKVDDIGLQITYNFTAGQQFPSSTQDNLQELQQAANLYIQGMLAKYTSPDPQSFTYPGFRFFNLDGAIQQITWLVDDLGKATTQANRNKEDLIVSPSYDEMVKNRKLQATLANAEKSRRAMGNDLRLGKGAVNNFTAG